jgi:hypothetical protein
MNQAFYRTSATRAFQALASVGSFEASPARTPLLGYTAKSHNQILQHQECNYAPYP